MPGAPSLLDPSRRQLLGCHRPNVSVEGETSNSSSRNGPEQQASALMLQALALSGKPNTHESPLLLHRWSCSGDCPRSRSGNSESASHERRRGGRGCIKPKGPLRSRSATPCPDWTVVIQRVTSQVRALILSVHPRGWNHAPAPFARCAEMPPESSCSERPGIEHVGLGRVASRMGQSSWSRHQTWGRILLGL